MTISAKDVKQLREITGAGMMDCKRALVESDGDINAAEIKLKELGLSAAAKRSGRATTEGRIFTIGDKSGAILELSSETDFVARNRQFIELGESLIRIIVEQRLLDSTNQIQELVTEAIGKIKENIEVRRFSYIHVEDSEYLATYIHGEGTIGVVVKLSVDDKSLTNDSRVQALAFDLCLHVAAMGPEFLDKESVSSDRLNELEQIFKKQAENMNKPAKVVEGIVKGKIRKELQEICLLEQPFVKEQKKSVQQIINNVAKETGSSITVSEYVYFKVGDKIT